jgi:tRNA A-37 threonylcarbamoyl transferase component Bud32
MLDSSLLVTEAVTNSESLMEYCQANFEGASLSEDKEAEKKKLLRKLVYFIRNIHEKGVCHYDLHAGNILMKFENKQSSSIHNCDLYLMDLHRVKILNRMSCRKRRYNLAQVFNSLSSILTETDKLDFLRSYGNNTLGNVTGEDELVRQIESQSSRIRNIHYRSRLKRCLKESSVFSKKRSTGMKIFFRKGYDTNRFAGLIEKHRNALVSVDKAIVMKRDSKTALTRLPFENKKIQSVVVKQYKVSCGVCLIKNIFCNSAGKKAWIAGNGLSVYSFNTPEPLALMEKKVLGVTTNSYLIMEDARDCLEMDRYILKNFHGKSSLSKLKKKRVLINYLAETMGRMHNQNIFHHDLKTCNIMVKEKGKSPYITFLDFDKVSFEEEITIRKRVKNLTQMNLSTPKLISLTDRLRFLKEYLRQCSIMDEKKNILREIVNLSKTEKILYVSSNGDVTEDW